MRRSSRWRPRFALVDGELELVRIDGKGWGKRPVKFTIDDGVYVDPGLALFAAFVVGALVEDAQRNAQAGQRAAGG